MVEDVKRIDVLFAIEREINGLAPQERFRVRQERSRPLVTEPQSWLREQRARLSSNNDTTKAINYCLSRWDAFTRFLDDRRLCMSADARISKSSSAHAEMCRLHDSHSGGESRSQYDAA